MLFAAKNCQFEHGDLESGLHRVNLNRQIPLVLKALFDQKTASAEIVILDGSSPIV